MGNNHLGYVFPGNSDYSALGVVNGVDVPPDYTAGADGLFADGFEIGSEGMWSSSVG